MHKIIQSDGTEETPKMYGFRVNFREKGDQAKKVLSMSWY